MTVDVAALRLESTSVGRVGHVALLRHLVEPRLLVFIAVLVVPAEVCRDCGRVPPRERGHGGHTQDGNTSCHLDDAGSSQRDPRWPERHVLTQSST